ncbi:antitoxin VbhA family protein (plasmid) [Brevibacillus composti]|uniref:Antitoxin VbhA family protein n=1 Tax=Brevibacillus composti TaxID=2796470 RepID=A0A7T5JR16_9BACL|nr:antitoxin VbhA family protein [Brevibacillus composti]QQE76755.1 antitoxin VbhA family protein [Brevibacillus composti]QUO43825.1 antitoxin VbhA family protein [Brevibacillus composti]
MAYSDEQLENSLRNAKASLAVEGMIVTDEDEKLIRAALKAEITHEEFLRIAMERASKAK